MALAVTHPTWGLGFGDEVWWRRLAQPAMHTWAPDAQALRLVEKARPKADPEPKALACYGLLMRHVPNQPEQMLLRFVARRPVSTETTAFLAWCSERWAAQGLTAVLLIWDNASWHIRHEVRTWLRQHNHHVKQTGQATRQEAPPPSARTYGPAPPSRSRYLLLTVEAWARSLCQPCPHSAFLMSPPPRAAAQKAA